MQKRCPRVNHFSRESLSDKSTSCTSDHAFSSPSVRKASFLLPRTMYLVSFKRLISNNYHFLGPNTKCMPFLGNLQAFQIHPLCFGSQFSVWPFLVNHSLVTALVLSGCKISFPGLVSPLSLNSASCKVSRHKQDADSSLLENSLKVL